MRLAPAIFSAIAGLFYSPAIVAGIRALLRPAPGLLLLDAPCGTGSLFELCRPCRYHGADLDATRVASLAAARGAEARVLCASAAALPYRDGAFDRVLASGLLHHVDEATAGVILAEFARVLRPDGALVLFDAICPTRRWNLAGRLARRLDDGKFVRPATWYGPFLARRFRVEAISFPGRLGLEYVLAGCAPKAREAA